MSTQTAHMAAFPQGGDGGVGGAAAVVDLDGFDAILRSMADAGYTVVGPTLRDGAVVYDEIDSAADLPVGWTDHQDAGTYRLAHRQDAKVFGYAVGPHSWKRYLFPQRSRLFAAERTADGGFAVVDDPGDPPRYAFVGVRACEVAAIAVQDRVFTGGAHPDPIYARNREGNLVVAVQCSNPAGTCFCASMGTGPGVSGGYDLRVTEIADTATDRHVLLVEAGTAAGASVLAGVASRPAEAADHDAAQAVVGAAAASMGRSLDTSALPGLLRANADAPIWDDVARRCLTCGNCTMVCPTCFCSTVEDTTDLDGTHTQRRRRWDSCFTLDLSYLHGGPVRESVAARYRQWITHKLDTWFDQFGGSGCVGCGRCITWCPVGIDITVEVARVAAGGSS